MEYGFQLLEAVKAGALDVASAQKQLKALMVSGTPPPPTPPARPEFSTPENANSASTSPGEPMPAGFAPVFISEVKPAATPDPLPTWGPRGGARRRRGAPRPFPAATPARPGSRL